MIQTTGLTKVYRRGRPPALLDLSFDTRPGMVTALLGAEEAGKTTALRLMVELERGQGITLFGGRTYRRLRRPERDVGVLLTEGRPSAGHPGRRARGHLRMLAGAIGVPARRADELLEQTRLAGVAEHRLRSFSPGMHRRLALAGALLGDPHALLLDCPTEELSPRNVEWFHSFLRSFAVSGGTVLVTTRTPQEASLLADRVITIDHGRLVADQPVTEFRRTRLHPEVAVRGPQMARLADLLTEQGAQVRRDGAVGIAVSGVGRTEIGELAYRHGILLHELADRVVEQPLTRPSRPVLPTASGRSGHVQLHPQAQSHPELQSQLQPHPVDLLSHQQEQPHPLPVAPLATLQAAPPHPTQAARTAPAPSPTPGQVPAPTPAAPPAPTPAPAPASGQFPSAAETVVLPRTAPYSPLAGPAPAAAPSAQLAAPTPAAAPAGPAEAHLPTPTDPRSE
ncbi:Putative ABC transporter ATP-binding protein [Kitasatospora sp. MMS16-BH015]|uniref:ATP-binding cassette domain-containing protein n=1 Tax=Kitasatospora sp. MMS16-BH015 TaxID=2018025 RepID=UPI000CA11645|nr:ABC transporter ATP-binding protein [Kitasatospora sp. MMS16-BH015]AUG79965.1 Putative ABC transporter ATP-binding protein [Kitasatospora sp. MMS16-BH015]